MLSPIYKFCWISIGSNLSRYSCYFNIALFACPPPQQEFPFPVKELTEAFVGV